MRTIALKDKVFPLRSLISLIGGSLLLVSSSVEFSYGNLNTYVISYLKSNNPSRTYTDWIYISTTSLVVGGAFAPVGGIVTRKIGLHPCVVIGAVILSGGYFLTFLALDWGLWACVFTIGASRGIGYGLIYSPSIAATLKWLPVGIRGMLGCIPVAAYGFGSVIWVPLQTAFANPDNIEVQAVEGEDDLYFLDDSVLSRVPLMFVVLGACFLALALMGTLLLREPTPEEAEGILQMGEHDGQEQKMDDEEHQHSDLPTKTVLRITHFWKIYVSFISISLISSFVGSFQKAFGQKYIQDDAFFALVGTLQNVGNGVARILGGQFYDVAGYKNTVFVITCIGTAVAFSLGDLSLFEPNSMGAKLFYAIWIIGLYFCIPGAYACYPVEIARAFGTKYCSTNYGVILSAPVLYSIVVITVTQTPLFDLMGYIGVFLLCGGVGLLGEYAL